MKINPVGDSCSMQMNRHNQANSHFLECVNMPKKGLKLQKIIST